MDNNKQEKSKDQTEDEKLSLTKQLIGIKSEQAQGNEENREKICETPSAKRLRKTKHSNNLYHYGKYSLNSVFEKDRTCDKVVDEMDKISELRDTVAVTEVVEGDSKNDSICNVSLKDEPEVLESICLTYQIFYPNFTKKR